MLPGKKYTIDDVIPILRRRAWLLALPPVVGLFIALVVSARLPNLYESDMLIAIVPQRVPDSFVRSTVTLRTEERLDAISTQVQTRTLIEQMILEFDLYPEERQRLPMEDVVDLMRGNIQVVAEAPRRGPRGLEPLHAFHVRFTYTDPNVAARITQRLGSLFVDQNARDRGALAEATNKFLDDQLAVARDRLQATESRLETFREQHGTELPTQMQANLQVIQSTQLQIQALVEALARDRDRKLMLERLYNEAAAQPVAATSEGPQEPARPDVTTAAATPEQRLQNARAALAAMEGRLTSVHPDVLRARRLVRDLETQVQANAAAVSAGVSPPTPQVVTVQEQQRRDRLSAMRAEIESLDRQTQFKESEERRLRGVVNQYNTRIEAVPGVESAWVALTRDYETQQNTYKELLAKSEQSQLAVDLEERQIGEQFRILEPAGVPVRPISPIRIQINAIGLGLGLLLGFGIAVILELKDRSFRSEADILDVLALPVLALIPQVDTAAERARRFRLRTMLSATGVAVIGVAAYVFWAMRLWNFIV